jgi:hypothetical protein
VLLWVLFAAFCTLGAVDLSFAYVTIVGHVTYYHLLLLAAAVVGTGTLMRTANASERSGSRTICRILIAYLLFEILVVAPVSIWLGRMTVNTIVGEISVRFTWLLFPVMLALCGDDRSRKTAGIAAVIAAVCLAVWTVYAAATGGGGYYVEEGVTRWRVLALGGGGLLLFAWPFALAMSRAVPRRYTAALLAISLLGVALTNSRSGLIAFAVAGVACMAMSGQIRRLVMWAVPAGLLAAAIGLAWGEQATGAFGYTLSHLFDISSGNGADRLVRWRLAWDFFASRPFNDYVWSWRYYLVYLSDLYPPHNFVLEIAVFEGVAGLAFYGSTLVTALRHAWAWGRKDAQARALLGYLVAYLVFSLQNADWYLPVSLALLVAALAGIVARVDQLRSAEATLSLEAGSSE